MKNEIEISIVSPVYQAEKIVEDLVRRIELSVKKITSNFEIILVEDGSRDNSWAEIERISEKNVHVKGLKLSRNFGQHPAIMAGLSESVGQWVVVMDCDLQDQPEEIIKLYSKAKEGYDIVLAKRVLRKDGFFKRLSSRIFSIVYGYLTEIKFDNSVANFGIYSKKVVDEVVKMNDYIKSFPLFVKWLGFKSIAIEIEHSERLSGKSTYSFSKLLSLAFNTIISFSNKPLKIFVKIGLLISFISFLFGILTLIKFLNGEIAILGYTSLILSIWFLSGTIITTIGVVGIYIGKIFDQSKNRKSYIIDKIIKNEL